MVSRMFGLLRIVACVWLTLFAASAQADSYKVTFVQSMNPHNARQYRIADVEASVVPQDGVVGFFRNHSDVGLPHGWTTFLNRIEATAADGRSLALTDLTGGRYRIEGWSEGPVALRYRMLLQHDRFPSDPGEDELAYARPFGVMWTGRALLAEGAPSQDVEIEFVAPEGWRVTTPWERIEASPLRFRPRSTDDLLDSAFMAGTHLEQVLSVGGGEARLGLDPDLAGRRDALLTTLDRSLTFYAAMFGEAMQGRLVVLASNGSFSGGGVMGRSISMLVGPDASQANFLAEYMIAHEAFHIWSARWRMEEDGRLEWLSEGGAEFYANLVRRREGLLSEADLIAELARRAGLYLTALQGVGIAEGGVTKLTGGERSYHIVYSGGMMVYLALDSIIRERSRNRRSMDDAIRAIHARLAADGEPLTLEGVAGLLTERFDVPGDFVQRHVVGREPLPLDAVFARYGLRAQVSNEGEAVQVGLAVAPSRTAAQQGAWRRLTGA